MDIPWRIALVVVAAAFVVYLMARMWPRRARLRVGSPTVAAARQRAREAKSPRERATALCDAATAAASLPFGSLAAAAYFLRAMRADPKWPGSVERAAATLARRRGRTLETMLWRRLAATPWDAEHAAVVRALVGALRALAATSRRHSGQAEVLERLLAGESLAAPAM